MIPAFYDHALPDAADLNEHFFTDTALIFKLFRLLSPRRAEMQEQCSQNNDDDQQDNHNDFSNTFLHQYTPKRGFLTGENLFFEFSCKTGTICSGQCRLPG